MSDTPHNHELAEQLAKIVERLEPILREILEFGVDRKECCPMGSVIGAERIILHLCDDWLREQTTPHDPTLN